MEIIPYNVVYIIANMILYMMMLGAVQVNCERRWSLARTLLLEAVFSAVCLFIVTILPLYTVVRLLAGFVLVLAMGQLFHKGSWQRKLFVTAASFLAMFLSEVLFMAMMPRDAMVTGELKRTYPVSMYSLYLFVNLVVITVTALLIRAVNKKLRGQVLEKHWLAFLAFPGSQFIALYVFFNHYIDLALPHHAGQLIVTIAVFVFADAALLLSLQIIEKNSTILARNAILEDQVDAQKQYYAQLTESYENIRKMRHDIDNHLYTIQVLLEEGHTAEAASYARALTETDVARNSFPDCANHVVASYLEKKKGDYQKSGVTLDASVILPAESGVSNPDLICALGNILDNAQEACRELDDPHVVLKIWFKDPYVSIYCVNPVKKPEGNTTSKQRKVPELERGIGLFILRDLAEKYDGQMTTEPREGMFETTLILKYK